MRYKKQRPPPPPPPSPLRRFATENSTRPPRLLAEIGGPKKFRWEKPPPRRHRHRRIIRGSHHQERKTPADEDGDRPPQDVQSTGAIETSPTSLSVQKRVVVAPPEYRVSKRPQQSSRFRSDAKNLTCKGRLADQPHRVFRLYTPDPDRRKGIALCNVSACTPCHEE